MEQANHTEMLTNKLKAAIQIKNRRLLCVVLLQDNKSIKFVSIVIVTFETLQKHNFEVLTHPSYSPDIAPLDFHLLGPL
ncbi:hypothetical protein LAZ67_1003275 [Cordylochernes scorpioides]|uniref:Histone-lysine N-methyltransferase SETMAR n=1 Tax=Cordylochernes scorpioides TaxID=51811 RepID=A0ABY6JXU1_9ARAC|nr:hypothetical protein LAZ67_1003275 [Cordylochernes scorpioides]